ncbi:hypothetical protein L1887_27180 [Cichorium endivia]|nr:hypothetical protein L1887_27180 [Cichorium endivia]
MRNWTNVIDDDDDFQQCYKPVWVKQEGVGVQEEGVGVPQNNNAVEEESVRVKEKGVTIQEESNEGEEEGVRVQEEGIGVLEHVSTEELAIVVAQMLDDVEDDDKAKNEHIVRLLRDSGYENNEILAALQEHIEISVAEDAPTIETQELVAETQHGSPIVTQDVEVEGIEDTQIHEKINTKRKVSEQILKMKLKNAV